MVQNLHLSGAELNPFSRHTKANDKETTKSGQSFVVCDSEKELQQADGMEPKDDQDDKESTTGSPKPSNRQGDGGPIVGHGRMQAKTKGVQRGKSKRTPAEASVPSGDKAGRCNLLALDKLLINCKARRIYSLMYSEEL